MPKESRLSRADFTVLHTLKPHRIHGVYFSLVTYTLPNTLRGPKIAFIVQKKIAPKAVTRNMIERRCRSVVRSYKEKLDPHDIYILHAKKDVPSASFKEIQKDIVTLFERATSKGTPR